MAVRVSMGDLIIRTRTLIADPSSAAFTDQQIQDALDFWRTERRYVPLRPMPTFTPGVTPLYLDYYSDAQNWEADVVLQDAAFNVLTPATSEYITGHWTFATQPNGIGVRATGKTYDIYASASDLLENWAAQVKLDFSFTDNRSQYQREQKYQMLMDLARKYRGRALVHVGRMVQNDAQPDHDGSGVVYPMVQGQSSGT